MKGQIPMYDGAMKTFPGIIVRIILPLLFALAPFAFALPAYAGTPLVTSARITSPTTVTIVYSEAVYTSASDYSNFTGALAGASLVSVGGSGTNVIALTFSGVSFQAAATGGITIASSVKSVADNSIVGPGPYSITDGQPPQVASFSLSSNLMNGTVARAGDTITATFNANEPVMNVVMTIATHAVSASGSGSGTYTASYTLTSQDVQDTVPVSVTFNDVPGNAGHGSFVLGGGLGPQITAITSDATATGSLNTGDSIHFILTLASPVPGATVSGSYNGVPLTWVTGNGGATYTATYTLAQNDHSTSAPLQITNVTVRDPSGNISSPASGYDIQKRINSQGFTLSQISAVSSPVASGTAPHYSFFSPQEGTIAYGGACSSAVMTAITGSNYLTLNVLPDGTYSNCTLTVTNAAGYQSSTLTVPPFTVGNGGSSYGSTSSGTASGTTTNPNSAAYAYKFYKPLDVGSTGPDVTALQNRLTAEGVYTGPVNGKYGPLTQAAVKMYQGLHSLKQLGNVGPGTRAALNSGL